MASAPILQRRHDAAGAQRAAACSPGGSATSKSTAEEAISRELAEEAELNAAASAEPTEDLDEEGGRAADGVDEGVDLAEQEEVEDGGEDGFVSYEALTLLEEQESHRQLREQGEQQRRARRAIEVSKARVIQRSWRRLREKGEDVKIDGEVVAMYRERLDRFRSTQAMKRASWCSPAGRTLSPSPQTYPHPHPQPSPLPLALTPHPSPPPLSHPSPSPSPTPRPSHPSPLALTFTPHSHARPSPRCLFCGSEWEVADSDRTHQPWALIWPSCSPALGHHVVLMLTSPGFHVANMLTSPGPHAINGWQAAHAKATPGNTHWVRKEQFRAYEAVVSEVVAPLLARLDSTREGLQANEAADEKAETARFEALHQLERSYSDLNGSMDEIEANQAWASLDRLRSAGEFARLAVAKAEEIRTGVVHGKPEEALAPPSLDGGGGRDASLEATPNAEEDEGEDDELLSQMVAAQAKKNNRRTWGRSSGGGGGRSRGKRK